MSTIQKELLELTKSKPKAGETAEQFTVRVLDKANKLFNADDDNWTALSEETQRWVNENAQAKEVGSALKLLELDEAPAEEVSQEGDDDDVSDDANEENTDVSTNDTDTEAPARPARKATAPAKKAEKVKAAAPAKKGTPAAAAPAKKAAAPKAGNGNGAKQAGRAPLFSEASKIKVLVKDPKHRPGTVRDVNYKIFATSATVGDALRKGATRAQLRAQADRGLIAVK